MCGHRVLAFRANVTKGFDGPERSVSPIRRRSNWESREEIRSKALDDEHAAVNARYIRCGSSVCVFV